MTKEEISVVTGLIRNGASDLEIYAHVPFWINIQNIANIREDLKNKDNRDRQEENDLQQEHYTDHPQYLEAELSLFERMGNILKP